MERVMVGMDKVGVSMLEGKPPGAKE